MTTKMRPDGANRPGHRGLTADFGSIDARGNLVIRNEDITQLIDRNKEAALKDVAESMLLDRLLSEGR